MPCEFSQQRARSSLFPKFVAIIFSITITASYLIGFLYDSIFLEQFGVQYYQMIGSPLEYLSTGGMYILMSYATNFTVTIFVLGFFGAFYIPIKRLLQKHSIEKYVDLESLPYILISLVPLAVLFATPVAADAKEAAAEFRRHNADVICMDAQLTCLTGVVLRYRSSNIIFYNSESSETFVFPNNLLISVKHGQ
jgi:hypothetical protein